jgi:uncharacterized surface protein with fasciclin (FAS1) repeats
MQLLNTLVTSAACAVAGAIGISSTTHFASTSSCDSRGQAVFVSVKSDRPSIFELALTNTDPSLRTLAALVATADLDDDLSRGEITVFAPTDAAFAGLPDGTLGSLLAEEGREQLRSILTYHVIPGSVFADDIPEHPTRVRTLAGAELVVERRGKTVLVNGNEVIAGDVRASNGVVHVIGGVLLPEQAEAASDGRRDDRSVGQLIGDNDSLSTLRAAVNASGFAGALLNDGPYTLLAPTDKAFASLPEGTLDSLLEHRNIEQLRSILRLHVIGSSATARDAVAAGQVQSRNGATLRFVIEDGQLFVEGPGNRARVIETDLTAENGVVHRIDTVLLPGQ